MAEPCWSTSVVSSVNSSMEGGMMLQQVKELLKASHDCRKLPMRWGYLKHGQPRYTEGGCFYGVQAAMFEALEHKSPYFYTVFHGDGAPLSFNAVRSTAAFNQEMMAYTHPWNKFIGTERSKR